MKSLEFIAKVFKASYTDIAKKLSLTTSTVTDWGRGRRPIPKEKLDSLSKLFKINAQYFVDEKLFVKEGQPEKYQYFINGQIANYTDKAGQKTVYTYTPYGEQDRISVLNPAGTEIYWQQNSYAASTRLLTGISNSENEMLSYHYDIWKRNDTKTVAGQTYTFGYDSYDRMTSITYPDNQKAIYTFDNLNRISTVNYKDSANTALMSPVTYTYSISSNVNTYTGAFANGLKQEKQTDAFRELTTMKHFNNSTTANWTETFGYDGFGNINSLNRNSTVYSYQYDGLNRIQQENLPGGQNKYMYDDKGNRLTLESDNLPTNLNGSKQYTYNAVNQVKTFIDNAGTIASYTYYGDGLRATKTVNGQLTRYVYVDGKIIDELDASGNSKARNIWGNELLYRKNSTATDSQGGYYFFNGHGDVVKVTDNSGNVLNTYDYDIWGNLTSKTETMNNPFKYTGEMQDDETGNIYLRARYYDPTVGRFINEDSYDGHIDNPLTLNLYTYTANNPLKYTDPTGHYMQGDERFDSSSIAAELKFLGDMWVAADGNKKMQAQIHATANALRAIGDTGSQYAITRISTFIPLNTVKIPFGPKFAGDGENRGFDENSMSVRTLQYTVVNADSGLSTTANYVGVTHQITSTDTIEKRAKNTNMSVVSLKQNGTTFLNANISVSNPLVKNAPTIDYDVFINTSDGRISGVANNFPAMEVNMSNNGGAYDSLYTYTPSDAGRWYAPFGLINTFNHEVK